MKLGDTTTSYFHKCLKNRQTQNQIKRLMTSIGELLTIEVPTEHKVIIFYKSLLGIATPQLTVVHPIVMESGYILNRA